jgi:hypothetical protein
MKQKLTSRKLWAAIAAMVTTLLAAIFKESLTPEAVELISTGVVALCVYIFGEGIVDASSVIVNHAVGKTEEDNKEE